MKTIFRKMEVVFYDVSKQDNIKSDSTLQKVQSDNHRSGTVLQYWGKESAEGNFRQSYGRLYPHGWEQSFVETRTL